ncbi:aquaporin-like protein [Dissophora ornata]|nr:hypothetical protein BGZ58_002420 [Dissophora ornata]KAI8596246.1 aquaporin-like protein [Dissophora ornata]
MNQLPGGTNQSRGGVNKSPGGMKGLAVQSLGEFLGTCMFMYLAVGGANSVTQGVGTHGPAYLGEAFAFGISLLVSAWAFFRVSSSMFNPAVAFSSMIVGDISVLKFVMYFLSQVLGAMLGVALARGTTPPSANIQQVNELGAGISIARAFFLEFFVTMAICFVYHMSALEKGRGTFMMAFPYGFSVFSGHLFATRYTNAALNPAQAFAVSVVARSFSPQHWVFWFGPLTGAILAAALHILFRAVDFSQYTVGIDAENEAQYQRAVAAHNAEKNRTSGSHGDTGIPGSTGGTSGY